MCLAVMEKMLRIMRQFNVIFYLKWNKLFKLQQFAFQAILKSCLYYKMFLHK